MSWSEKNILIIRNQFHTPIKMIYKFVMLNNLTQEYQIEGRFSFLFEIDYRSTCKVISNIYMKVCLQIPKERVKVLITVSLAIRNECCDSLRVTLPTSAASQGAIPKRVNSHEDSSFEMGSKYSDVSIISKVGLSPMRDSLQGPKRVLLSGRWKIGS